MASHLNQAPLSSVAAMKVYVFLDSLPDVVYDESTLTSFLNQVILASGLPPAALHIRVTVWPWRIVSPSM